jgi:hypothetical protein
MKFYNTIDVIRNRTPPYSDPFILQMEESDPNQERERVYIIFNGVEEYLSKLNNGRYSSCHEVFLSSTYNVDEDIMGRIAFDIDMKPPSPDIPVSSILPEGWMDEMEKDIIFVLCKQYPSLKDRISSVLSVSRDANLSPWVWMTSPSDTKISKHLVISKIVFSMWRNQMKILVKELKSLGKCYSDAIDNAIYRRLGSLRLPLNRKNKRIKLSDGTTIIRPSPSLYFNNATHSFIHGIVTIHNMNISTIRDGIVISPSDLAPEYQDQVNELPSFMSKYSDNTIDYNVTEDEMSNAFYILDKQYDTGLKPGSISGAYLSLIRQRPGKCPISGRIHDSDNAYMFKKGGVIFYGCHRGCTISIDNKERKYISTHTPENDIIYRMIQDISTEDNDI